MDIEKPLGHVYGPIEPEQQHAHHEKKSPIKRFFSWIWGCIKGHKLVVAFAAAIVVIIVLLYTLLPVVTIGQYTFVNADTTARIEIGQTAKLKFSNVTVKINRFISDVCPVGTCFGSGPVVDYEFMVDGQKYADTSLTPNVPVYRYQIQTVKTDNKTYAEIKIVKSS